MSAYYPWKEGIIEFIGSTAYVFVAGLATVSLGLGGAGIPAGFTLAGLLFVAWHLSGGHINPAITIGLILTKEVTFITGLIYLVFQFLGSFAGALLVWAAAGNGAFKDPWNLGAPDIAEEFNGFNYTDGYAIVYTIVASAILGLVYYATMVHRRRSIGMFGPLAVGFANVACVSVGSSFSAGILNPARALGAACLTAELEDLYVFFIGPIVGVSLSMFIYKIIYVDGACDGFLGGKPDSDNEARAEAAAAFYGSYSY